MTTIHIAWLISVAIVVISDVYITRHTGTTIFDCTAKNGYTVRMLIKDILWGSAGLGIFVVAGFLIMGFGMAILYVLAYLEKYVLSKRLF
jgi:hypothetical protein